DGKFPFQHSFPSSFHDKGSGGGEDLLLKGSLGKGMNSSSSMGGSRILPCFQSSLACSILSLREETKFHQINLSPNGSPPRIIRSEASLAIIMGSTPGSNTSICPAE